MDGSRTYGTAQAELRERLSRSGQARLAAVVADLSEVLGSVAARHRVTRPELLRALRFAADVGLATDERRNEWLLLCDVLGVSQVVEAAATIRPDGATAQTPIGPFFRDGAPERRSGDTLSLDGVGTPLAVTLRVRDLDGLAIAGAQVDVWHANASGVFENQDPDSQPEFNLRGRFRSDGDGVVTFRTIRPAGYRLPGDGPVADLMAMLGLPALRPAHIQVRVLAEGFQTLVTHVFDAADPNLAADPLFCVRPDLVAGFGDPSAPGGCHMRTTFTLARSRPGTRSN